MPLFVGAVPRETIEQVFGVVDLKDMRSAWICCSGSFRLEQALAKRYPGVPVHSNDVSLLSTAVAQHAIGKPLDMKFKGRLAFLEDHIVSPLDRLGALAVAVEMAAFTSPNVYAQAHFAHYQGRVAHYIKEAGTRLDAYMSALNLTSYACVDFRRHAAKAVEEGGHIFAWPPTYKGGYERLYRFVDENTDWERPEYDVFEPKQLTGWMDSLDDQGAAYTVCADHEIEGRKATGYFKAGRARTVYLFTSRPERSSVRKHGHKSTPFVYRPVDPSQLTAESVQLVPLSAGHINFLKDSYLSAGLEHTTGTMSFGVLLDGTIAGAFIYQVGQGRGSWSDPRLGPCNSVYLLSDFSLSRDRRLSKLIAMLASGQEPIEQFDLRRMQRTEWLVTTAFTKNAVSMKYRGIYELLTRKPGALNYISEVRRDSSQQIYAAWWRRYAAKN